MNYLERNDGMYDMLEIKQVLEDAGSALGNNMFYMDKHSGVYDYARYAQESIIEALDYLRKWDEYR